MSDLHQQNNEGRRTRARIMKDGQEAVINMESLRIREDHLISLKKSADDARKDFSDAVAKVAEDAGLLPSVVRAYVMAKCSDSVVEAKRKNEQLGLCFEGA